MFISAEHFHTFFEGGIGPKTDPTSQHERPISGDGTLRTSLIRGAFIGSPDRPMAVGGLRPRYSLHVDSGVATLSGALGHNKAWILTIIPRERKWGCNSKAARSVAI